MRRFYVEKDLWGMRHFNMKRDLWMRHMFVKRDLYIRRIYTYGDLWMRHMYMKRDLYVYEKRPICIWKETYMYMKRDLYVCEKRPICIWKETYQSDILRDLWMRHMYVKRDLYVYEKRPINETYVYEKRRINQTYLRAKRPINEMHLYRQRPVNETYFTWKETYQWDICIRTETCKQNPMCAHERETCNTRRVTRVLASEHNPFMCTHNPMCHTSVSQSDVGTESTRSYALCFSSLSYCCNTWRVQDSLH